MRNEINRIHWKCRRGMREIDLLLREFSKNSLEKLNDDQLLLFEDILNYDDQSLYDFIFKQESLGSDVHEEFISKYLKKFKNSGNF